MNDSKEEIRMLFSLFEKNKKKMDDAGRSLEDEAGMTTETREMVKCWEIYRTHLLYPGCTASDQKRGARTHAFCRMFCRNAGLQ